jgi:LacI family transcriptional regulator
MADKPLFWWNFQKSFLVFYLDLPDNEVMRKIPRIVLMIEPLGEYVQGLLRGIVKYSNTQEPWSFYREPGPKTAWAIKKLPQKVPVITIGYREIIPGLPQILGESEKIGQLAAEHFLNKGFKYFGYCGFDEMHWSRERAQAFGKVLQENGHTIFLYKNLKSSKRKFWELEQQDIAQWLESLPKPIGILACNDDRGLHLINASKLAKMRIPEDVSILGVDNDEFVCGLTWPPLSSIALSTEKAGYEVGRLLSDMMKRKRSISRSIYVNPTHVITRQSTDIVAVDDADVSQAVHFIQNNTDREVSVDDVVNMTATSRRTLEKKFRMLLNNRSIYDEIRRSRVNRIISMLLETDLSITQIGLAMDFTDLTHISRLFKEETGQTPLSYRNKHKT